MLCKSQNARQIQWPQTRRGHLARLDCPYGSRGMAEWMCSMSGEWLPFGAPDLSRCVSDWSRQFRVDVNEDDVENSLRKDVLHNDILKEQFELLSHFYSLIKREVIYGGDLINAAHIFSKFAYNFNYLNLNKNVKQSFVKVCF